METTKALLPFVGPNGVEAVCRIEIIPLKDGRHAVICQELDDNPGQSVSLSWEAVVAKVSQKFHLSAPAVVWIEHNEETVRVADGQTDRWQLVTFKLSTTGQSQGEPEWRTMTADDWQELGLHPRV